MSGGSTLTAHRLLRRLLRLLLVTVSGGPQHGRRTTGSALCVLCGFWSLSVLVSRPRRIRCGASSACAWAERSAEFRVTPAHLGALGRRGHDLGAVRAVVDRRSLLCQPERATRDAPGRSRTSCRPGAPRASGSGPGTRCSGRRRPAAAGPRPRTCRSRCCSLRVSGLAESHARTSGVVPLAALVSSVGAEHRTDYPSHRRCGCSPRERCHPKGDTP